MPCPFSGSRGSNAPSNHTVFNCFREFQCNKFSVEDAPRSDRLSTSLTEQTIEAVRKIIEDDPHPTYQQIETSLPPQSIHYYLNIRKVYARWVPLTLTDDQKQVRVQFTKEI